MDSKDFRSKLKNHEAPFNPEAWSQMEEMLDTLPAAEVEKAVNYKKWLLLLLGLLLLSVAVLVMWNRSGKSTMIKSASEMQMEQSTIDRTIAKKSTAVSVKETADNRTPDERLTNKKKNHTVIAKENDTSSDVERKENKTQDNINSRNKMSSTVGEQSQLKQLNQVKQATQNSQATITQSESKAAADLPMKSSDPNARFLDDWVLSDSKVTESDSDRDSDRAPSQDESQVMSLPNKEVEGSAAQAGTLANSLKSKKDDSTTFSSAETGQPLFTELVVLDLLRREALAGPIREEAVLPESFEVKFIKSSRLYYTASAGVSDINSNRGYYLGAGVFWDIDKIIGLEPTLSFSSAWDINGTSTSFLSSVQELNLVAWIHLNLWRTDRHKVSLELAPSLGATWSITKSESVSVYRGITPNYKAGISYTYFLRNGNGVGVKGAFSRFDSGFVALKYFRKF